MSTELEPGALLRRLATIPADERMDRLRAEGAPEAVLIRLAEAAEHMAIGDLADAIEATAFLVDLADGCGDPVARVRARRARAQALAYASRYDEAIAVLDDAFALAAASGDAAEEARIRLTRLHALAKLGRHDEAVREGELARQRAASAGRPDLAGRADINLGVTHRLRGDARQALAHFDRARAPLLGEPLIVAQLDSNRAEAMLDLGRFGDAERAFRAALAAFEAQGASRAAAIVEGNLADLMSRQGRLDGALKHFERARRALDDRRSPGELARIQAEQAEAFAAAALFDEALETYRVAIPPLEAHGLLGYAARARAGLGRTLMETGEYGAAATELSAAGRLYAEIGHRTGGARVRLLQGQLTMCSGRRDEARRHLLAALGQLAEADAVTARVSLALLELDEPAGGPDAAQRLLDEALAIAEAESLRPNAADALHARATLRRRQGRAAEALDDLRRAATLIERLRGRLRGDRPRRAFLGRRIEVYHDLVACLLEAGDRASLREAFECLQRGRCRALLDLLDGGIGVLEDRRRKTSDPAEADLFKETIELQGELTALYGRHEQLPETGGSPVEGPAAETIEAMERRLRALESRLAATGGSGELFAPAASLDEVRANLADGTALVEYAVIRGHLCAFVVLRDGLEVRPDLAPAEILADRLGRFEFQIGRAAARLASGTAVGEDAIDDARYELAALYDLLLRPLAGAIEGARRLVFVPSGPLHALPFAALHDGAAHLIETRDVVHCPSAGLLRRRRSDGRRPGAQRGRSLVVGAADARTPRIDREIELVAALVGDAEVLSGADATVARVTAAAEGRRIVHVACHGRFTAAAPLASGLRLADRWLTIRDAYAMRVDGATIVLSGCETGGAAVESGDELEGLLRAFLAAGAGEVVMSLWTVNDQSTADLMEAFYHAWQNGNGVERMPASAALRAGQCALLRERPHPVFWAPFVVAGTR